VAEPVDNGSWLASTRIAVHHAIIDLYELYDREDVDLSALVEYTDLSERQVFVAMQDLQTDGIIKMDEQCVITEAKNEGYHPTAEKG
jgi:predicted methyltransferase